MLNTVVLRNIFVKTLFIHPKKKTKKKTKIFLIFQEKTAFI